MSRRFVVDNSVVMAWCFNDEDDSYACSGPWEPYADSLMTIDFYTKSSYNQFVTIVE
jgi:hypothetical protein